MTVTLKLEGDCAEMSPNRRMHWAERSRLNNKWRMLTAAAWNAAGHPAFQQKVKISFHVFRGRVLDHDNIVSSGCLKACQDGLRGRAFPDDSLIYVERGGVKQTTGAAFRLQPCVFVTIETLNEDPLADSA